MDSEIPVGFRAGRTDVEQLTHARRRWPLFWAPEALQATEKLVDNEIRTSPAEAHREVVARGEPRLARFTRGAQLRVV